MFDDATGVADIFTSLKGLGYLCQLPFLYTPYKRR